MINLQVDSPRVVRLILLQLILTLGSSTALAQEIQRPFDETGSIQTIDRALEEKLQLFPDYEGFREARLYEVSRTEYVLEIIYRPNNDVLRDQQTLALAEVRDLRARVTKRYNEEMERPELNQTGRT